MNRTPFRQSLWNRLGDASLDAETTDLGCLKTDLLNLLQTMASYPIYKAFEDNENPLDNDEHPLAGTLPFYGLRHFLENRTSSELEVEELASGIKKAMEHFEPRLQDIRVPNVQDLRKEGKATIVFLVTARVRDAQRELSEQIVLNVSTGDWSAGDWK